MESIKHRGKVLDGKPGLYNFNGSIFLLNLQKVFSFLWSSDAEHVKRPLETFSVLALNFFGEKKQIR